MFILTVKHHTNKLRRFCIPVGVVGMEKYGKTDEFILRKCSFKDYIIVKIVPPPTSYLLPIHDTEIFRFFLIIRISSVPNFCKSYAFGTVLHNNVIALAGIFPISCQWKDISV